MGAALRFKHVNVPRQQAEQARLKVVQGPDFGSVFVLTGTRATLGRGEENDIMVSDLKASRLHAQFELGGGGWTVKDIGSANGLLHNGKATRLARIQTGDQLTFGETTLEFVAGEAGTMMLVAPPRSAGEVDAARAALEEQRRRVRAFGAAGADGPSAAPAGGGGKRLLLYGALAAAGAFVLLMPEPKPKAVAKKKAEATEDLRKYMPAVAPDPATAKMVEQFFKAGFREYMAGNFARAKTQFETVLQMSPGHPMAELYLQNCRRDMDEQIDSRLKAGKRAIEAGKLKDARGHYETVMRALHFDQGSPAYIEARDQLEKVNEMISGPGGEGKR